MATVTGDGPQVGIGAEESVRTARSRAPAQVRVILNKAAGDEKLVLSANLWEKENRYIRDEIRISNGHLWLLE